MHAYAHLLLPPHPRHATPRRPAGEKGQKNGHAVTFIHLAMKAKAPALLKKLQKLVFKAEADAKIC